MPRKRYDHICEECNKPFWSHKKRQATCSLECGALLREGFKRRDNPPPGNIFSDLEVSPDDESGFSQDSSSSR